MMMTFSGSQRAMVMIGDAIPHSVTDYNTIKRCYPFVKTTIDWRKEADALVGIVSYHWLNLFLDYWLISTICYIVYGRFWCKSQLLTVHYCCISIT